MGLFSAENSCSLHHMYMNSTKCKNIKNNFEYSNFLETLSNSFDLYCLCLVFLFIANFLRKKGLHKRMKPLGDKLIIIIAPYLQNDLSIRKQNIDELKQEYYDFLLYFKLYLKKNPSPNTNVLNLVKQINSKEIKQSANKKICVEPKPIYNPISGRCLAECKNGFIRNNKFRCIKLTKKNNSKLKKSNTSINNNSTKKRDICKKLNKDYNHITKRCNNKCPPNKIRDSKFKCINCINIYTTNN